MDNQTVIKAAIRSAVTKGIRDIRRDPNRSLRRLVDLGIQFGRGSYQQTFFSDAQNALKNRNSGYYELVSSLIRSVDEQTLETLGLNVGYMSWTLGAQKIRAYEKEHGVNVPWTLLLKMDEQSTEPLDFAALVDQGQNLGIYTFFLFVGQRGMPLDSILPIAEQFSNCAFFMLAGDEATNDQLFQSAELPRNMLFVPRGDDPRSAQIGAELVQKKRMFGFHCEYNATNAEHLLSDVFLQSIIRQGTPFLFLIAATDCDRATRDRVHAQVLALRAQGRYPLFPIDLYRDVQQVDHIISNESCLLALDASGAVLYPPQPTPVTLHDHTLEALIGLTMPPVRHKR